MGKPGHTEQGKMLIGLSNVIRNRRSDVNRTARWNHTTLVDVSRPEPKVYKVTYQVRADDGSFTPPFEHHTEFLSTTQMSITELQALREFVATGRSSDTPQFSPTPEEPDAEPEEDELQDTVDAKPKATGTVKLTGMEKLERMCRSEEPPISEAIRDTAVSAPKSKYRTIRVVKTYTVVREEVFLVRFTDKTLEEFRDMGRGNEEDRMVCNYLLRRQTDKLSPAESREVSKEKPTFQIKE